MSMLKKNYVGEEGGLVIPAGELHSDAIPREMYMQTTFHCPSAEIEVYVSNMHVPDCSDDSQDWECIATPSKLSWVTHPFKWMRAKLTEPADGDVTVYILSGPQVM